MKGPGPAMESSSSLGCPTVISCSSIWSVIKGALKKTWGRWLISRNNRSGSDVPCVVVVWVVVPGKCRLSKGQGAKLKNVLARGIVCRRRDYAR